MTEEVVEPLDVMTVRMTLEDAAAGMFADVDDWKTVLAYFNRIVETAIRKEQAPRCFNCDDRGYTTGPGLEGKPCRLCSMGEVEARAQQAEECIKTLEAALREALDGWERADERLDQEFRLSSDPPCEREIAIAGLRGALGLVADGEVTRG